MNKNVLWIIIAVLCVAVFFCTYLLYDRLKDDYAPDNLAPITTQDSTSDPSEEDVQVQTTADFTVYDADGNAVKLSDYFGKPIVLNFWASWCPPCKSEMPHFEAAYHANPDIQFLMVNMTSGDNIDDAKAFIAENGYTFPVLFDTTGEAGYIYQASSLPMTMFIGTNGSLVTYAIGMLSEESLNQGIEMIKTAAD